VAVKLTLLGSFDLRQADGGAIDLPGQKDRALLAFLAIPPGAAHTREKLASLLWGDHGEAQARDSLKHALTRLRQCLEPAICADRQMVRLESVALSVDVAQIEQLTQKDTLQSLGQAAALYRGDLLEGLSVKSSAFEDWLLVERQRMRQIYEATLNRLIEKTTEEGDLNGAADPARLLLAREPLHEAASRALMRLFNSEGQTVEALKLYHRLRTRLRDDLGVAPEPQTTRLYESIRRQRATSGPAVETTALAMNDVASDNAASRVSEKPSIAVLPFDNLSSDPGQQYFSDGITDDVITELSRFRSLFVIARQSSFAFRGQAITVQRIARELGVAYVVEGSVRRDGDRVRINAQLVDAASGNQLWAERYDRVLLDIFAVQDEVAQSVAAAVSGRVEAVNRDRAVRLSPAGVQAYDLILRAKAFTMNHTRANNAQALVYAERAIELDPTSARAAAHSAWCHFYDYMACWRENPRASLNRSFELARRAVALDESDCFPRTVLGIVNIFRREYEQARANMLAGLTLNPNDFLARRFYAMYLVAVGQAKDAIEQVELGRRLNPFDTRWVPWNMGIVCFSARRYEDAVTALTQAHNPINEVRGWLAASYAHAGCPSEARATLEEFLAIAESDMAVFPGRRLRDWKAYWHGALEYRDQKDFDHLFDALRKAGLTD
jgi:TolB-like protein